MRLSPFVAAIPLAGSIIAVAEIAPTFLFAQVAPEGLSGNAGWLGAGLLGSVLSWLLLVHLPNKDKQLERIITANDARFDKQGADNRTMIEKLSADWRAVINEIHQHCKDEVERIIAEMKRP